MHGYAPKGIGGRYIGGKELWSKVRKAQRKKMTRVLRRYLVRWRAGRVIVECTTEMGCAVEMPQPILLAVLTSLAGSPFFGTTSEWRLRVPA